MPITAYEMKRLYPETEMTCVECNAEAISISHHVGKQSGVSLTYTEAMAQDVDYAAFDAILVASMTTDKQTVLNKIAATAKPGTLIGIRTVEELRHILYEPVDTKDIPASFTYLGKTDYKPEHVNTTLLYRLDR